MHENWLPLGPIGVIIAFNFPVAVWSWKTALAIVCGDPVIWKPSEKTPLVALACQGIFHQACTHHAQATGQTIPEGLLHVLVGDATLGDCLVVDKRLPLISATGSCRMGRIIGPKVAERLGRSLLEPGGNNVIVVSDKADQDLALQAILFGAVGRAGQRCTTTRRVFAHASVYDALFGRLKSAYQSIAVHKIGNPPDAGTLVGPLIDKASFDAMQETLRVVMDRVARPFLGNGYSKPPFPMPITLRLPLSSSSRRWISSAQRPLRRFCM